MDAKQLKDRLTDDNMIQIIESIGGVFYSEDDTQCIFSSICHHSNKPKLYYYKETKAWFCYNNCGHIGSILDVVCESKEYTLQESINYICVLLNISVMKTGFYTSDENDIIDDWSFIRSYKRNKKKKEIIDNFYDKSSLNIFQNIYTSEWINDGINKQTMRRYNIKYSTLQQRIIIPHYNIDGELFGIRGRAMLDEDIESFGKYSPFINRDLMYAHPLSRNLYGIYENKDCIRRVGKVMLVESEKGCLQSESFFGEGNNFTVALCGCASISSTQIRLLQMLGVKEVMIAFDKQFEEKGDEKYIKWMEHIKEKIVRKLAPYFEVYIIWCEDDRLGYKDSPTDKGRDILLQLMKEKRYVTLD